MTYSKARLRFCESTGTINNFTILGPNYETVLNYWKWIDSLTKEQWETVKTRHRKLDSKSAFAAANDSRTACRNVTSVYGEVYYATEYAINKSSVFGNDEILKYFAKNASKEAALEILSMHRLLEQGKKLVFVPLFDEL